MTAPDLLLPSQGREEALKRAMLDLANAWCREADVLHEKHQAFAAASYLRRAATEVQKKVAAVTRRP